MPLMKIVRAHTPEAVVIAISVFTAALLWLLYSVYTMNANLSAIGVKVDETTTGTNKRVDDTNERIDRIVAIIPDVRIKLAQEEISKPIRAAVVVTEPSEASPGKWVAAVHLLETTQQRRRTYVVSLNGPGDKSVAYLASGAAAAFDSDAISFKNLSALSSDLGKPAIAPNFVVSTNSLALRRMSPKLQKALEEALKSHEGTLAAKDGAIASRTTSWERLSAELNENAPTYEPVPTK